MKVTLEFDTNDENDFNLHKTYIKAEDMTLAFWDITQLLRSERKYPRKELSDETYDKIVEIEDTIWEILRKYDLTSIIN
jgi:hypothetical protein